MLFSGVAESDSFKELIMPGKVVSAHSKYEPDCNQCHDILNKDKQITLCLDCHKLIRSDVNKKEGFHGRNNSANKNNCKNCHIEHVGRDADIIKLNKKTFPHDHTDFKLKGAHKSVRCSSCHIKDKKYSEAPKTCLSCHKENPHKERLGKECVKCHNEKSWVDIDFNHAKTKFSLSGKHKDVSCKSCHIYYKYKSTPKSCYSCHGVDDIHGGDNGDKCKKCHTTKTWKKTTFDHNKKTKFDLEGRHSKIRCNSCHVKNPYKVKINKSCISCHKEDDEHNSNYGVKCQSCHVFSKWKNVIFDHDRDTEYKLTGEHKKEKCSSCHKVKVYKNNLSTKCYSCHKSDDAHKGKSDKNCDKCHSTKSWNEKILFDHDLSEFPLIGLHAITACTDCHEDKAYQSGPKKCYQCHKDDDDHKGRLGNKCGNCHTPNNWKLWIFDHEKDTQYKLSGAHKDIHCYDCHKNKLDEIEINQSCSACHLNDDPHNYQFGRNCGQCHDDTSFSKIKMRY